MERKTEATSTGYYQHRGTSHFFSSQRENYTFLPTRVVQKKSTLRTKKINFNILIQKE